METAFATYNASVPFGWIYAQSYPRACMTCFSAGGYETFCFKRYPSSKIMMEMWFCKFLGKLVNFVRVFIGFVFSGWFWVPQNWFSFRCLGVNCGEVVYATFRAVPLSPMHW